MLNWMATTTQWSALFFFTLLGLQQVVHAGPVERLVQVAFHPTDPKTYVLSYAEAGGGLLVTHDGGASFQVTCTSAILEKRSLGSARSTVAITGDGHILHGSFDGLVRGSSEGCGFEPVVVFADQSVTDIAVDPDEPSTVYVLTSIGGKPNGMYKSSDNGASFEVVGKTEEAFFSRLRIARLPTGKRRFYQSLARPTANGNSDHVVRSSENDGQDWTEHELKGTDYAELRLLGVDRRNPSRIYAAASRASADGEILLVNDSAGETAAWEQVGAAIGVDSFLPAAGGGFWAVETESGDLLRSNAEGRNAAALATKRPVSCIAESPLTTETMVCAVWELFRTDAQGFMQGPPIVDFRKVTKFSDCSGENIPGTCEAQMNAGWCTNTHYPVAPICLQVPNPIVTPNSDGGQTSGLANSDAGAEELQSSKSKSGGCQVSHGWITHRPAQALFLLSGLVLLLRLYRARRRQSRSAIQVLVTLMMVCTSACGENTKSGVTNDAGALIEGSQKPDDADEYAPGMTKASKSGRFKMRLLHANPAPPELGDNTWKIAIENSDGSSATGATIGSIQPYMPEHGHGTSVQAVVRAGDAPGTFEIERINLRMPKLWEVRIEVQSGTITDMVVFKFWIEE